ncbi:hypothetical protein [Micromonospora sp. NPDC023633]|uniref:hypothetical protein n=1 Tax=Micromonospora sp. NPDC023633 TaxID=3154320 RepID=UPI0033D1542A
MNIIEHALTSAQPTTGFRVEERTIDAQATPDGDGLTNVTLTARDIHTVADRDGALNVFRTLLALDPDKYRPGSGYRLVLVEAKDGDR